MFKKLKGYMKRLQTPKKDKNFSFQETDYGEYDVSYVSGVEINNISNIILEISYSKTSQSMKKDIDQFMNIVTEIGLKAKTITVENTNHVFIAGNIEQFLNMIISFDNTNKFNSNKVVGKVKNILTKIDRIRLVLNSNEIDNCSYFINQSNTSSTNPVDVQFIDTYYVSSDIITNKINIIEELLPLTIMGITYSNIPGEYTSIAMYVSDFVFKFNYDLLEDKESILNLDKLYHSNFDIPGYKNLFDINLRVIESNDSYYKDIDEVLSE